MMRFLLLLLLMTAVSGCSTREVGTVRPVAGTRLAGEDPAPGTTCNGGKTVWVTIDGTGNTPVSRTAATRLHEMVEAFSYTSAGRPLAIWYAEGVGSGDQDILGKALGTGIDEDIRKAYAFLTRTWRPCDHLFLNGFSRGAYSVRALGGLLYMAGIPNLSERNAKERNAIVDALFKAYKTRIYYTQDEDLADRRAKRIAAVYKRYNIALPNDADRAAGYLNAGTRVSVDAMTIWDSVQALGKPDRGESPTEGSAHFLITACNVRSIFQPLSLDDNRVYSFTPILAGGDQATAACPATANRQNINRTIEEVWFSGAHADVGGTYEVGGMLDGELASVSLNWVLERLASTACDGCRHLLALPEGLKVAEDRLAAIHDGKRSSVAYLGLYRQSRKPLVYWHHVYQGRRPTAVHASVFDRLEWLFAFDQTQDGCNRKYAPGKAVICAQEIAANGLAPELVKRECLDTTDWGYRLKEGQKCVDVVGIASHKPPNSLPECQNNGARMVFTGMVYKGEIADTGQLLVRRVPIDIPYPPCMSGTEQANRLGRRVESQPSVARPAREEITPTTVSRDRLPA